MKYVDLKCNLYDSGFRRLLMVLGILVIAGLISSSAEAALPPSPTSAPSSSVGSSALTNEVYQISCPTGGSGINCDLYQRIDSGSWRRIYWGTNGYKNLKQTHVASYSYKYRRCNSDGCTGYSGTRNIKILAPLPIPAKTSRPTGPSAVEVNNSFYVRWSSVSGATSYDLYKGSSLVKANAGLSERQTLTSSGTSKFGVKACNSSGCSSTSSTLSVTAGVSAVRGYIDGVSISGYDAYLQGWACQTYDNSSIDVQIWAGGASDTGTRIAIGTANQSSETAVASECKNTGTTHRFEILLPQGERELHAGKAIYVHGISNSGTTHVVLGNSGTKLVPILAKPAIPEAPEGPVSVDTNQPFLLEWVTTSGADSYDLYRDGSRIKQNAGLSYSDSVSNAGNYDYTVQACNAAGCIESSALEITAKEPSTVEGHVGWLSQSGSDYYLNGWACQTRSVTPISVKIFTTGGLVLGTGTADQASEKAIDDACLNSESASHRYKILLSSSAMIDQEGNPIHVQGLSNQGTASEYLYNSGNFLIPGLPTSIQWEAATAVVGQDIILQNAVPAIVACQSSSNPEIEVELTLGLGKSYVVTETTISDWQCFDNQSNMVLEFSAPLKIEKLPASLNLKEQNK